MRLIDADALQESLGFRQNCKDCKIGKNCAYETFSAYGICTMLADAPTIIPELLKEQEPLMPKKWVPKGQVFGYCRGYYCPQCNTSISSGDRYCHWCGRRMKWSE